MTKSIALNSTIAVLAALAMVFAYATPAFAAMNSSSITITTTNRGTIDNNTSAKSHTGDNDALGSRGGRGGDGGEIESDNSGSNNNGGATSGNGGNGGNGGAGGFVSTGNASSTAMTTNLLNDTDVEVAVPTDMNSSEVVLETNNDDCDCNVITNDTRARARSGENEAQGSVGGNADDGGDIEGGVGDFNNGGATSGTGGAGGSGGMGGTVLTGRADSFASTINWLNTSIIRVRN